MPIQLCLDNDTKAFSDLEGRLKQSNTRLQEAKDLLAACLRSQEIQGRLGNTVAGEVRAFLARLKKEGKSGG